jgi:hypothetical protein
MIDLSILNNWVFWVVAGYWIIGMILGFLFGSICSTFHADNHIVVWMIAWPIKLFQLLYSTISGKVSCRKYGHLDEYDYSYMLNSKEVDYYCSRCGKKLGTKLRDEFKDTNYDKAFTTFNEIANKMFPDKDKTK